MKQMAFALVLLAIEPTALAAEGWPRMQIEYYAVSGVSGPELYASIDEKGPLLGRTRAIAHTNWKLKWSRKYEAQGAACMLVSAKPFLTVITTLPKPSANLGETETRRWKTFIDGIAAHEKVHAADIGAMVQSIIRDTVGLTVQNDPQCKLVRTEVLRLATKANEEYKTKSRVFDRAEMARGGNMHGLILALVNGR